MNKELGHFVDEFSEEDNYVFDGTAFVRRPRKPEPKSFGGVREDAPCCGCCGSSLYDSAMEYERQRECFYEEPEEPEEEPEEPEEPEDEPWWENDPEDRYLDSHWEDANEYGMEGCCGDF